MVAVAQGPSMMSAPTPKFVLFPRLGLPRRQARSPGQPSRQKDSWWGDFWKDQVVWKSIRSIIFKACLRLTRRGSEKRKILLEYQRTGRYVAPAHREDPFPPWEELRINLPTYLWGTLRVMAATPSPSRARRKKILAWVAKLNREQFTNYQAAVAPLLQGLGLPAREKEITDRRRLSRWAKRLTGSYCDREVAALLTAARRHYGYQKPRVSMAAIKLDRRRNPAEFEDEV